MSEKIAAIQWRTFFTGVFMAVADLVPGISGGTIALLSGIYGRLLAAISHFDLPLLKLILGGEMTKAWRYIDGFFLLHLGLGMVSTLLLVSKLIAWLMLAQPLIMWSLFLGLILVASILLLRELSLENLLRRSWLLLGLAVSILLAKMSLLPQVDGFSGWGYLWLMAAGALAISAMILPGVSGSFILLILGIYPFLIQSLAALDLQVITIFAVGCGLGLMVFSRLISHLLKQYTAAVMSMLAGLMLGSVVKLWPWKHTISYRLNSHGLEVPLQQENLMPWAYSNFTGAESQLGWCVLVFVLAGLLVVKFGRVKLQDLAA
ncbi:MAG: DUF368 domain-containing protein [Gammaproteobacteria bacterium]|nr:DUF368 domain-containing protein [Gammaproteobacteria bacterium]